MKNVAMVGEWLRVNGFPYWRVTHPNNPKMIFLKSQETDESNSNLSLEESIKFFEDSQKFLNDGQYIILGRKVKNGYNGETVFTFQVYTEGKQPITETIKVPEIAGIMGGNELINKINEINDLKLKHHQEKTEWQIKEMQYKRALQEAKNSGKGFDKISGVLGQVLELVNHPAVNKPAVSGTKSETKEKADLSDDMQTRIGNALNIIADVLGDDEKTVVALEKLAKFATKSPELFKGYLNSL